MNEKKRDEKRVCMHEKERNALETHLRKNVYLKKKDQKKNTRINDRARATTTRYFFILSLFIRMVFFLLNIVVLAGNGACAICTLIDANHRFLYVQ